MTFLVFLPIVFIIHWILPNKYRWLVLLFASYYFYMSWNPELVFLILTTTLVSYSSTLLIAKLEDKRKKKLFMILGVGVSLGILFFFKYFNFLSLSVTNLLKTFSLPFNEITLKLILPIGISFYTFQTLSYVLDVYYNRIEPEKHFGYYALYVSFFPQLVAGPIERSQNLLPQIKKDRFFSYETATYGLKLMAWGFFKKIVIADTMAKYVNLVYDNVDRYTGASLLIATIFFAFQIYCDFSGYSDIAIGTANLFGINLMTNFKSPYFSSSVKEFWNRWHISLSTWFRDYVYIPLGGNRVSKIRNKFNIMVTFLLSGLWHGASWHFVIWGGVNGIFNTIDTIKKPMKREQNKKIITFVKITFIFSLTCFTWVLFRANSIIDAIYIYKNCFLGIQNIFQYIIAGFQAINISKRILFSIVLSILILITFDLLNLKKDIIRELNNLAIFFRWSIYIALISYIIFSIILNQSSNVQNEFIYFQF